MKQVVLALILFNVILFGFIGYLLVFGRMGTELGFKPAGVDMRNMIIEGMGDMTLKEWIKEHAKAHREHAEEHEKHRLIHKAHDEKHEEHDQEHIAHDAVHAAHEEKHNEHEKEHADHDAVHDAHNSAHMQHDAVHAAHDALHQDQASLSGSSPVAAYERLKELFANHVQSHDSAVAAVHERLHEFDPTSLNDNMRPPALPGLPMSRESTGNLRRRDHGYGGDGDGLHLGGYKAVGLDHEGISNNTWNFMMGRLGVKSVVDVGCGRGISSNYFREAGAETLCIEGSHDAVSHSMMPASHIVEHDFTRGPWWPEKTYDALWCVDVLEHIGRQYHENLLPTLQKGALLFVAASNNGGWHHSEVRSPWWWRAKMESFGFVYSQDLTDMTRDAALATSVRNSGGRIIRRMLVFINPKVASRPEHLHLFSSDGCIFEDAGKGVPCDERFKWYSDVDVVPPKYEPLLKCDFTPKKIDSSVSFLDKDKVHSTYGVFDCVKNTKARGV